MDKQKLLWKFVVDSHGKQKRKYTGESYTSHLYRVAQLVNDFPFGYEIGLCHDLIEDTHINSFTLKRKLLYIGYLETYADLITKAVIELTDVYTKENFPSMNRRERKQNEAERLWKISDLSQTIKYADLIDNTESIVEYDKSFAKIYLQEKEQILVGMNKGDSKLYQKCSDLLRTQKKILNF